ncbi:MAG: DUF5724 domain-containing protein, partial [Bacilli bacterium]
SLKSKISALSILVRKCFPQENEDVAAFKKALHQAGISERRMLETAMFAPQWCGIVEVITGWSGLKQAVWFFHAHMNDLISPYKESQIKQYTPLNMEQLKEGVFDSAWFHSMYETIGEKRFSELYRLAKYTTMTETSLYRRAQLFADAAREKISVGKIRGEITKKRNREYVRALGIYPLQSGNTSEVMERYDVLQEFLRDSAQFGSVRRMGEQTAVRAALANLAQTAGFASVDRLRWFVESEKLRTIEQYRVPFRLENITIQLAFGPKHVPIIEVIKDEKKQKSIPKQWNKHPYVVSLKEAVRTIKAQQRSVCSLLQQAMIEENPFTAVELNKLLQSEVFYGHISALVWKVENTMGFLCFEQKELVLQLVDGSRRVIESHHLLTLALPNDFVMTGEWSAFVTHVVSQSIVQPFKQVLREYYPLFGDEVLGVVRSERYAGYEVGVARSKALLSECGWYQYHYNEWQKTYYKHHIVAIVETESDPYYYGVENYCKVKGIQFFCTLHSKPLYMDEVPATVFSETMRDIDLVVSVAHTGAIDVEASLSTVKMRHQILSEIVRLFKLENVTILPQHVRINGVYGEYSVHLGSGIVHMVGVGVIGVESISSRDRGALVLPFIDGDPKTAEITSKVLLFANDGKIKDEVILSQIPIRKN